MPRTARGDILVFLPGAAEIRRAMRESQEVARRSGVLMLPLYSDLSAAEQDRALAPAEVRKVVMATNVAESSVTIEGVTAVIDSGLARIASQSPWTGLPTLQVGRISQASARQRAGRAGRTGPGQVLAPVHGRGLPAAAGARPAGDGAGRAIPALPGTASHGHRIAGHNQLARCAPCGRLERLRSRCSTSWGRREAWCNSWPASRCIHGWHACWSPPLQRGVGEDGCKAAALLGSGARFEKNDLLAAMDADVDYRTRQQMEQLRRIARPPRQVSHDDDALLMAVLSGFPDRVARRRVDQQVLLSTGASAEVAGERPQYEFMVALDVEDRKDKPLPRVRLTARIEPEWLIELFPERIQERSGVEWNRIGERVEAVSALLYEGLVIQESRGALPEAEAAADLLAQKAQEAGIDRFLDRVTDRVTDREALQEFLARVAFAGIAAPDVPAALRDLCTGLRSFAELKNAAARLVPMLEQNLSSRRLSELAPSRIRLAKGRETKVHYELGKPPWIASRLQDFFGMRETPRIGSEHTPVVVHLLAPNQRAVQTTSDLAGFWERLYPQVRRELMRRYPRHAWPERPQG